MIKIEDLISTCDNIECPIKKAFTLKHIWKLYKMIEIEKDLSDFGFEIDSGKEDRIQKKLDFIKMLME